MKKIVLLLCAFLIIMLPCLSLADGADELLDGKQDLVVLGSVKDILENTVVVTVDHVLARDASKLIGKDISIKKFSYTYCDEHSDSDFRSPVISDNIVISLNKEDDIYVMANTAYKVDSNEFASCKILVFEKAEDEDCTKDLLNTTCFVRANGMVNDFEFDSEGRIYAVYPQSIEQCVSIVNQKGDILQKEDAPDTLPAPHEAPASDSVPVSENTGIVLALAVIIGAALGFAVFYFTALKKYGKR